MALEVEWTEDMDSVLCRAWEAGYTTSRIGRLLGVTQGAVMRRAVQLALPHRSREDFLKFVPVPEIEVLFRPRMLVPETKRSDRTVAEASGRAGTPGPAAAGRRKTPPYSPPSPLSKKRSTPRRALQRRVWSEEDTRRQIEEWTATNLVKIVPPAFAAPTQTGLTDAAERERVAKLEPEGPTPISVSQERGRKLAAERAKWQRGREAALRQRMDARV